jgi:hypothetical protein
LYPLSSQLLSGANHEHLPRDRRAAAKKTTRRNGEGSLYFSGILSAAGSRPSAKAHPSNRSVFYRRRSFTYAFVRMPHPKGLLLKPLLRCGKKR